MGAEVRALDRCPCAARRKSSSSSRSCEPARSLSAALASLLAACSAVGSGSEHATTGADSTSGGTDGGQVEDDGQDDSEVEDDGQVEDVPSGPRCVTLSTGTEVCEPPSFEIEQAEEWMVLGIANHEALAALLEPHGLRPVSISGPVVPTALICLVAIRYHDTDIGPYREFIVQSLVQVDHPTDDVYFDSIVAFFTDLPGGDGEHEYGFLMHHLTLDGDVPETLDDAIAGGRELMGFPKRRGTISLGAPTSFSRSFTVSESDSGDDSFEVTAGLTFTSPFPVTIPATRFHRIVTLGAPEHFELGTLPPCWIDVHRTTTSTAQLFTALDTLTVTGRLDEELDALGFLPGWWVESPTIRGSLTRDTFCL